jgi:hypothetical protein
LMTPFFAPGRSHVSIARSRFVDFSVFISPFALIAWACGEPPKNHFRVQEG